MSVNDNYYYDNRFFAHEDPFTTTPRQKQQLAVPHTSIDAGQYQDLRNKAYLDAIKYHDTQHQTIYQSAPVEAAPPQGALDTYYRKQQNQQNPQAQGGQDPYQQAQQPQQPQHALPSVAAAPAQQQQPYVFTPPTSRSGYAPDGTLGTSSGVAGVSGVSRSAGPDYGLNNAYGNAAAPALENSQAMMDLAAQRAYSMYGPSGIPAPQQQAAPGNPYMDAVLQKVLASQTYSNRGGW